MFPFFLSGHKHDKIALVDTWGIAFEKFSLLCVSNWSCYKSDVLLIIQIDHLFLR